MFPWSPMYNQFNTSESMAPASPSCESAQVFQSMLDSYRMAREHASRAAANPSPNQMPVSILESYRNSRHSCLVNPTMFSENLSYLAPYHNMNFYQQPPWMSSMPYQYWPSQPMTMPNNRTTVSPTYLPMDLFPVVYPQQGPPMRLQKRKRCRTVFCEEQLRMLERAFQQSRYATNQQRYELVKSTQLQESTIDIWFKNRRAKQRLAMQDFKTKAGKLVSSLSGNSSSSSSTSSTSCNNAVHPKNMHKRRTLQKRPKLLDKLTDSSEDNEDSPGCSSKESEGKRSKSLCSSDDGNESSMDFGLLHTLVSERSNSELKSTEAKTSAY